MMEPPGRVLGVGRAATVYDIGQGRVLRRYDDQASEFDARREAEIMTHARLAGLRVPEVFDASRRDLIMEKVDGPSLLEALKSHPSMVIRAGDLLAQLHRRLAQIPARSGLSAPFGPGASLLHLDLHPGNVLLSPDGPVLIDWQNAASGPRGADIAKTWVVLATAAAGDGGSRFVTAVGRRLLVGSFLRAGNRKAARPWLEQVVEAWEQNPRISAEERRRAGRLIGR